MCRIAWTQVYLATAVFSVGPGSKVSILCVSPIYRKALDLFCHSTELGIEWSHNWRCHVLRYCYFYFFSSFYNRVVTLPYMPGLQLSTFTHPNWGNTYYPTSFQIPSWFYLYVIFYTDYLTRIVLYCMKCWPPILNFMQEYLSWLNLLTVNVDCFGVSTFLMAPKFYMHCLWWLTHIYGRWILFATCLFCEICYSVNRWQKEN